MKCPYCNNEMEEGYIKNEREILAWTPKNMKKSWLSSTVKKYEVKLGTYDWFFGSEARLVFWK